VCWLCSENVINELRKCTDHVVFKKTIGLKSFNAVDVRFVKKKHPKAWRNKFASKRHTKPKRRICYVSVKKRVPNQTNIFARLYYLVILKNLSASASRGRHGWLAKFELQYESGLYSYTTLACRHVSARRFFGAQPQLGPNWDFQSIRKPQKTASVF
jgi:hypothetical protein